MSLRIKLYGQIEDGHHGAKPVWYSDNSVTRTEGKAHKTVRRSLFHFRICSPVWLTWTKDKARIDRERHGTVDLNQYYLMAFSSILIGAAPLPKPSLLLQIMFWWTASKRSKELFTRDELETNPYRVDSYETTVRLGEVLLKNLLASRCVVWRRFRRTFRDRLRCFGSSTGL